MGRVYTPGLLALRTEAGFGGRGADDNYGFSACSRGGACGLAVACGDGSVRAGSRVGVVIGRAGGAGGLGFCSLALAVRRAICSWLALTCSATFALSRAISSWLVLSCAISCSTFARSLIIFWSNCASSGGACAAVGPTSCCVVWA